MNTYLSKTTSTTSYSGMDASVQRVLRNTYALLGLSLIPTALGAIAGIQFNFSFFPQSPFIGFMLFLGIAFGFMWGIEKNKDTGVGVALLLGFTFFMGLMLSRILQYSLGLSNGASLIALATGGTGAIFFTLAGITSTIKKDLSYMGKFLFTGMILLLLAAVANIFFQIPAMSLAISAVAILLFSAYLIYDINRIVMGGETNYVTATLSIYLSLYNIFSSLLHLLIGFGGED